MRTVLVVAVATLMWVGGPVAAVGIGSTASSQPAGTAAEADAVTQAKKRCVSKREFRKIKQGWKARRIHRNFDTNGRIIFAAPNPGTLKFTTRQYRVCDAPKRGALTVDFGNGRLIGKHLVFTSLRDTPKCMSNPEFRRIKRGMLPRRVTRITDTAGGFLDGFAGGYARGYERCDSTRSAKHVVITYVWRGGKSNAFKVYDKRRTTVSRR